jgi:phage-related protein
MSTLEDSVFKVSEIKNNSKFCLHLDYSQLVDNMLDINKIENFVVNGTFYLQKTDVLIKLTLSYTIYLYDYVDNKINSFDLLKDYDIILSRETNDYYDYILTDKINIYDICNGLIVLEIDNLN